MGVQKELERIPRLERNVKLQLEFQCIQWIRIDARGCQVVEQVVSVLDVRARMGRKDDPLNVDERVRAGKEANAMGRKTRVLRILKMSRVADRNSHALSFILFMRTRTFILWSPEPLKVPRTGVASTESRP